MTRNSGAVAKTRAKEQAGGSAAASRVALEDQDAARRDRNAGETRLCRAAMVSGPMAGRSTRQSWPRFGAFTGERRAAPGRPRNGLRAAPPPGRAWRRSPRPPPRRWRGFGRPRRPARNVSREISQECLPEGDIVGEIGRQRPGHVAARRQQLRRQHVHADHLQPLAFEELYHSLQHVVVAALQKPDDFGDALDTAPVQPQIGELGPLQPANRTDFGMSRAAISSNARPSRRIPARHEETLRSRGQQRPAVPAEKPVRARGAARAARKPRRQARQAPQISATPLLIPWRPLAARRNCLSPPSRMKANSSTSRLPANSSATSSTRSFSVPSGANRAR